MRKGAAKHDAVADNRRLRANLLAPDPRRSARRQPHIPNDSAIGPPVVPGVRAAARGNCRNGCDSRTVVDLHGEHVRSAQAFRDVQRIGGEASLVGPDLHAIQPDSRLVERRAEVQLDMRAGQQLRSLEAAEVPGCAQVIMQCADVPRVRHRDRLRVGGYCRGPSGALTAPARIGAKLPVAVEIRAGRSRRRQDVQRAAQQACEHRRASHGIPCSPCGSGRL